MSSEKTLLQAALSHLELALMNICEQAGRHEWKAAEKNVLTLAVDTLQQLAVQCRLDTEKRTGEFQCSVDVSGPGSQPILEDPISNGKEVSFVRVELNEEVHTSKAAEDGELHEDVGLIKNDTAEKDLHENIDPTENNAEHDGVASHPQTLSFNTGSRPMTTSFFMSKSEANLESFDMLKIMMEAFDSLEQPDDIAAVEQSKLRAMSEQLGCHKIHIKAVFSQLEKTHDGLIYKEEWKSIAKEVLALHKRDHIIGMIKNARRHRMRGGNLSSCVHIKVHTSPGHRLILSYKSLYRMAWDMLIMTLLMYVALALPLTLAFMDLKVVQKVDQMVDWIFVADLILNFRTTYMNDQREEVWDAWAIAKRYLKSWFTLDFVSSVPLEQITSGLFPRLQPAKLLKFGKVAKASKMLRVGKVAKLWSGSEIVEFLEEMVWSNHLLAVSQGWALLLELLVVGHWMACLLLSCGGDSSDAYLGRDASYSEKYMVALYWAIMTMTTVGYGDVPMSSDWERIYAIVAMIIGGSFYGYIIGVVTTILSHRDLNQRVFQERMDIVVAWLNTHYELPPHLRRRVWRHFKEFLTATKAVEDTIILNDLPPQLCKDVSVALLHDSVRHHPIFANLSMRALSRIVSSILEVRFHANEIVVDKGDSGTAMFILDRGFVHIEHDFKDRRLCAGDSFGEEILLRDIKQYTYSARTHSKVRMFKILRDDFVANFRDLHHDVHTMIENFYVMRGEGKSKNAPKVHSVMPGMGSLIAGGSNGLTSAFPDAMMEHFSNLTNLVDKLVERAGLFDAAQRDGHVSKPSRSAQLSDVNDVNAKEGGSKPSSLASLLDMSSVNKKVTI